jgi:hypothetical protein
MGRERLLCPQTMSLRRYGRIGHTWRIIAWAVPGRAQSHRRRGPVIEQHSTHVALDDGQRPIVAAILRPGAVEPDLRSIPSKPGDRIKTDRRDAAKRVPVGDSRPAGGPPQAEEPLGHVRPTRLFTAPPLGLDGVRAIRATVRLPLVAIGALNAGNISGVVRAGADGICVVSAIVAAPDPSKAASLLRRLVGAARSAVVTSTNTRKGSGK